MSITRRSFFSVFTATLLPSAVQQEAKPAPLLPSVALPFDAMPARTTQAGESRAIMKGRLATGEELEMHHTKLNPGGAPHAGHAHVFTEMWLIREGTVEFTVNGKSTSLGPGSVAFAASNDFHAVKNVGDTQANYFVVAVGPGAYR